MVRKIKVVDVYSQETEQEQEPETERPEEETPEEPTTLELKNEVIPEEEEEEEEEQEPEPPKSRKKKQVVEMPTTEKTVQQVQCSACGKSMSAKSLRYSHAKTCTERSQEPEPVEIPAPKIEPKKTPAKRSKAKPREAAPTYDADEVPPPPPPPASRLTREKHETPEQFWRSTITNMREKKLSQYKSLLSNAF
jgi:hypothetical protein